MKCECCDTEMLHIGNLQVVPRQGGLFDIHQINVITGKTRVIPDLAPVEMLDTLRKWGVEEDMIKLVEEDLPNLGEGGS
ncbi:MAG: hypothetical protein ACYSW3_29390 [Planctomycetota bacterium]|jgi:hypothetical protein